MIALTDESKKKKKLIYWKLQLNLKKNEHPVCVNSAQLRYAETVG